MLHKDQDASGASVWSPGMSTVSRNLLLNSYGAGHGIDHDDGSMNYSDVGNVVAFSHACKGNFGSSRNCSANLVIAPGLGVCATHMVFLLHVGVPCSFLCCAGHSVLIALRLSRLDVWKPGQ